jgi:hypothetical protein
VGKRKPKTASRPRSGKGRKGTVKYDRLGNASYFIDGVEVAKETYDARFPDRPLATVATETRSCGSGWPMKSIALAVHPEQVAEANERNRKAGVNVTYESDGTAVIPDRGERRRLLRLEGMHDRQGGYGD